MVSSDIYSNKLTKLCKLGYKYGTDKCPQIKHSYTPFYYKLLNARRKSIKKVLEIGIGYKRRNNHTPEVVYDHGIRQYLERGASLLMWRDFFPNAKIYGADFRTETMFEDERIKTYLCDERVKEDIVKLIKNTGSDIDVVIDDASHHVHDQVFLAKTLLSLLKKDVVYIIEDVDHDKLIAKTLGDGYEYYTPVIKKIWKGGLILVIRNKNHGTK